MTTHLFEEFKERFFMRLNRKPNWNIKEIREEYDEAERLLKRETAETKLKCDCGMGYTDFDLCGRELIRETKYKRGTPLRNSGGKP